MLYEIWAEGYISKEGHVVRGCLVGRWFEASTFKDACEKLLCTLSCPEQLTHIDDHWYYFGSRLFDNECDARKSYG